MTSPGSRSPVVTSGRLRAPTSRRGMVGFTLVEVMVAITLLAIVLIGLTQMTFVLARRTVAASVAATRSAILTEEVNRLSALPYGQLVSQEGTVTVDEPPLPYKRIITIDKSTSPHEITVSIVPLNTAYQSQSVVIKRLPGFSNPFDTKP